MPNGGSDCCGTCWFNGKNKGEAGYNHVNDPEKDFCVIRNLTIENAFWTYCSNHPVHNRTKIDIPVGPVFVHYDSGERDVWMESPDNEPVHLNLLRILSEINETPDVDYPAGVAIDDMSIWQVGEFAERRAISQLERIARFDPNAQSAEPYPRKRKKTVELALKALALIQENRDANSALPEG